MTFEDLFAYGVAGLIIIAVAAVVLIAANAVAPKAKKTRSRTTYTHGIDDVSVDGDGSGD